MFVRFRQTPRRLQLSLVETRRVDGRVHHEHIASLGALRHPPESADRVEFWRRLFQRLGRLGNRLDGATQREILIAVHARVPMPTLDEQRALRLEHAKQHETAWRLSQVHIEGIVESNRALATARRKGSTRVNHSLPWPAKNSKQPKTAASG